MSTFNLPRVPDPSSTVPTLPSPTVDGTANPLGTNKPTGVTTTGGTTTTNTAVEIPPPANPGTDKTVDPEAAMANSVSSSLGAAGSRPPLGMPDLPSPTTPAYQAPTMPDIAIIPPALPTNVLAAAPLPEISVTRVKPKVQTWMTKLAPAIIPPRTNFIYRRVLLPEEIYATRYENKENRHLPFRETREDYEALLFSAVQNNDIDATRALLNVGTGLEITNGFGETPLMVAKRSGAMDVAQLLVARGAN